jgi:hypothetical protein
MFIPKKNKLLKKITNVKISAIPISIDMKTKELPS